MSDNSPILGQNPSGIQTPIQTDAVGRLLATASGIIIANNLAPNFLAMAQSGLLFTSTTGKQTTAGAITVGHAIFNPNASGKTLYVLAVRFAVATSGQHQINAVTADPALGTAATPVNCKLGGPASVASCSFINTAITPSGTLLGVSGSGGNTVGNFLENGELYVVPPNNGLEDLIVTSTNGWQSTYFWFEQ